MRSIRGRILILVLGLLSLSLSFISYKSYRDAQHEIEELFDAHLAQTARLLAGMVASRDMSPDEQAILQGTLQAALDQALLRDASDPQTGHEYEAKLAFKVFDEQGRVLLQSAGAPAGIFGEILREAALVPAANGRAGGPHALAGYHRAQLGEHQWRLFMLHDQPDRHWILIGEREDVRGELVGKIARRSLLPDLIGVPLLALLVWLAVGWGLRPLVRMVQLLKTRDPDNLAPLLLAPLPQELEPVVASLNRLLLQVTHLLEREKRFIADAAHELRTPLAVLRIHAQNALETGDAEDRASALGQLINGVDRTTRVVTQLLTLARLEPDALRLSMTRLDLRSLAQDTLAELIPLALSRAQELTLDADEDADHRLTGDPASLATLLQNLVGNALQYTPAGGQIQVCLHAEPQAIELRVLDSGPGVPGDMRAKLCERFFRQGPGQGAGLGLSIASRIAQLHGAQIELLDSPLGGLQVRVRLPRT